MKNKNLHQILLVSFILLGIAAEKQLNASPTLSQETVVHGAKVAIGIGLAKTAAKIGVIQLELLKPGIGLLTATVGGCLLGAKISSIIQRSITEPTEQQLVAGKVIGGIAGVKIAREMVLKTIEKVIAKGIPLYSFAGPVIALYTFPAAIVGGAYLAQKLKKEK